MQANRHQFTRTSQLPNRCIEGLYLVTLLQDGFGFDVDDRRITYALEVSYKLPQVMLLHCLSEF